jgi:hypothetical protein
MSHDYHKHTPKWMHDGGGLAGVYVGASGSATAGVGIGANVLFSSAGRSVALQPLSVQGQIGLDLTLGVSGLDLRPVF